MRSLLRTPGVPGYILGAFGAVVLASALRVELYHSKSRFAASTGLWSEQPTTVDDSAFRSRDWQLFGRERPVAVLTFSEADWAGYAFQLRLQPSTVRLQPGQPRLANLLSRLGLG